KTTRTPTKTVCTAFRNRPAISEPPFDNRFGGESPWRIVASVRTGQMVGGHGVIGRAVMAVRTALTPEVGSRSQEQALESHTFAFGVGGQFESGVREALRSR